MQHTGTFTISQISVTTITRTISLWKSNVDAQHLRYDRARWVVDEITAKTHNRHTSQYSGTGWCICWLCELATNMHELKRAFSDCARYSALLGANMCKCTWISATWTTHTIGNWNKQCYCLIFVGRIWDKPKSIWAYTQKGDEKILQNINQRKAFNTRVAHHSKHLIFVKSTKSYMCD